jgi:transposase
MRHQLRDDQWDRIMDLIPGKEGDPGRTGMDNRLFVESVLWLARTGAPWRDLPERFGNWNAIYKNVDRWSTVGVWARVLGQAQAMAHQGGDVDWIASIDSTIVRVHQRGSTCPGTQGARSNYKKFER